MDSPGYDPVSVTGQVASGSNIICFTTGRVDKAHELLALPWTNINAQYANGNTPLILAVQGNN